MGYSAYGLTSDSPLNLRTFPIGEFTGSTARGKRGGPIGVVRNPIRLTTEEEVDWVYQRADRKRWSLIYRCFTTTQLTFFETMDAAIAGDSDPFYFCPDVDGSPQEVFLVRMDASDWLPVSQVFLPESGITSAMFQFTMNFTELSAAAQILA